MIEIVNSKNVWPKLETIPVGTIFSWPVCVPKSKRAYAIKAQNGILRLHDVSFASGAEFLYEKDFKGRDLLVEIEGQILIKRDEKEAHIRTSE